MKGKAAHTVKAFLLLPALGCFAFFFLYVMATLFYPGGSQADVHAKGFSWMHNYWCNLLNERALNGERNAAKPFAYAAMYVLLATLMCFWAVASQGLLSSNNKRNTVLFCGGASVLLLPFLATGFHDAVINGSGFFGLIALLLVFLGLYKKDWYVLFAFGMLNLLLVALNNYLYYTTALYYLPLVQKISFVCFLLWVSLVTIKIYRQKGAT